MILLLNPFMPGAGAQPPESTGRRDLLDQARIALGRTRLGKPVKSLVAIGLRGTGKTVLLQRIRAMAESDKYHTCFINAHDNAPLAEIPIPHLRRLLLAFDRIDSSLALWLPAEKQGVTWTDAALDKVWRDTDGYPYFVQEWGYRSWNFAAGPAISAGDIDKARAAATMQLDESFFRVRFGRLTPKERDYVRAMAELGPGPHRSVAVADLMGARVQALSSYRSRLIDKGMIYSPAHGVIAFSVPLFDRFLKRIMPDWLPSAGSS
jgi:hypothetical protein